MRNELHFAMASCAFTACTAQVRRGAYRRSPWAANYQRITECSALNPVVCCADVQMSLSAPSAASMCRLPTDVLSSCILPLLDVKSLLHVAHCSRLLLSAADCPAAWSPSLVSVNLNHPHSSEMLQSLALRRANLSVRDTGFLPRSVVVRRLRALPSACKLVSLDSSGPIDWAQIAAHPAAQHLRSLTLSGCIETCTTDLRALAALPRLATLRVDWRVTVSADFASASAI